MWRTTGDIFDGWEGKKDWMIGMTNILDLQVERWRHSGPNRWNDPDMLEVGNGGMSHTEYVSHFSLWAMLAAPLIAGNDLSNMDEATRQILTNADVIAVDQDPLGQQARRLWKQGDLEIWARPLQGGDQAVVLFNRGQAPANMKVTWAQLNLPAAIKADVKDLWAKTLRHHVGTEVGGSVAAHGVLMLRITPKV
jgi:alpha-galactosidase